MALIEHDPFACATIRENKKRGCDLTNGWPLFEVSAREFDYGEITVEPDLLTAGLPCQPFSVAGKGRSYHDDRDMFSEVVRAIRELRPKAILIENVKGLVRSRLRDYFDYLLLAIASPDLARDARQDWHAHLESLRRSQSVDSRDRLRYDVYVHTVNAADYGIPQWRERVLIIAFRSDLKTTWTLPPATHGLDELIWSQWKNGHYWSRHGLCRQRPGLVTQRIARRVKAVKWVDRLDSSLKPWKTVRDAIADLPKPRPGKTQDELAKHFYNPGARPYANHNGSLIDEPAKTLKAGNHGVPGGENTLALGRGRVRYFTVTECARLQSFPDDFVFIGPWSRVMRQIGNAVPVGLACVVAQQIRLTLNGRDAERSSSQGKITLAPRIRVREAS